MCVSLHDNSKGIYLLLGHYVDSRKVSDKFAGQITDRGRGHSSEGSRSLGKVVNYSVIRGEIPSLMAFSIVYVVLEV